jgi:ribosomal 50S subunit-recycling heat shock protein
LLPGKKSGSFGLIKGNTGCRLKEGGINLRLDKFLKVSRIIKRRTVANTACAQGRVKLNGRVAKPGAEVKKGDIIEIQFGERTTSLEVLDISEHVPKDKVTELYKLI